MRDQGVVHFSLGTLSVQFHPRAVTVSAGAEDTQPKPQDSQEDDHANLLERIIPP